MKKKSIVTNSVYNVVYQLTNMLFPLITSIYVSHILMASGIGKVSFAQNIAQYFIFLAPLGIVNYGTREIAKIKSQEKESNRLFSELFLINLSSSICCSFLYYIIVLKSGFFDIDVRLYLATGLPIIFNIINVDWFYQGKEEFVYIAIRNTIVKAIALLAIFTLVRTPNDYVSYALIYAFGIIGNYIFNVVYLFSKGVRLSFSSLNIKRHLKPIFILLSSNIAIEFYILFDTTMLGSLCNKTIVGYYTNSMGLVKTVVALIASIGSVLLPRLSVYKSKNRIIDCGYLVSNVFMVMLFFAIPCGTGVFLLADISIPLLFGDSFVPAIQTTKIASIIIFVLGFSNLFGTQVLLTFGQEKKLLFCTCIAAILNIILNIVLIPLYQQNGAVVSSVCCESIVTILTFFFAKHLISIKIQKFFIIKTLFATIIMCLAIVVVKHQLCEDNIVSLIISILVGGMTYFLASLGLKHPVVRTIKSLRQAKNL